MKIFCIGFQKTGTTTLAQVFRSGGFKVTGPNGIYDPQIAQNVGDLVDRLVGRYDVFQDNPWPLFYKEMAESFPEAYFIHSHRDTEAWISSVVKHFGGSDRPMLRMIYGVGDPRGNEGQFVETYERHNAAVSEFFSKGDFNYMSLDVSREENADRLKRFVGLPSDGTKFPHVNVASDRSPREDARRRRVYGRIRAAWVER
jgi:hypothetical protein